MEIPYLFILATLTDVYKKKCWYHNHHLCIKKMAAAINHMLIFSHSSAPFEWVIFSVPNVGYYFFSTLG